MVYVANKNLNLDMRYANYDILLLLYTKNDTRLSVSALNSYRIRNYYYSRIITDSCKEVI
jgi:hypothetical protein